MGFFTLCVSGALVVLQATLLLTSQGTTQWTFRLARAVPDAEHWQRTLDALLPLLDASRTTNGTGGAMLLDLDMAIAGNSSSEWMTLCLRASIGAPSSKAYACMQRGAPRVMQDAALDAFNPHLLLLALCCVQALLCCARARHHYALKHVEAYEEEEEAQGLKTKDGVVMHRIPLPCLAVLLLAVFVACLAVQAAHSDELVRYPTLVLVILWWLTLAWFSTQFDAHHLGDDETWGFVFHQQTVVVPLAVLALAVFGSRQWPTVFANWIHLNACASLLWMSLVFHTWPLRVLLVGLVALFLASAHTQFGAFDTWRYASTYMACVGLLPLLLGGVQSTAMFGLHRLHSLSLMAANAALLSLIITLSQLDASA